MLENNKLRGKENNILSIEGYSIYLLIWLLKYHFFIGGNVMGFKEFVNSAYNRSGKKNEIFMKCKRNR